MNTTTAPAYTHAAGKMIEVNGKSLWVEEEGSGEALILLPGGPAASHLTFHPYFSALADRYRVIYYDYYGRGKSDRPNDYKDISFAGDVEDLEGLRRSLGLESLYLYGFSYGGMVAQEYALKYGTHVKKLILANTLHSPEMWQKNHENINREISLQYPEAFETITQLRKQGVRSDDPRMLQAFSVHSRIIRFYNPDNAAKLLKEEHSNNLDLYWTFVGNNIDFFLGGMVAQLPDFRPRLKDLRMPVLILAGRYDRALYPAYQYEFKQFCPQATFLMMEKSGTYAHIEETELLMETVREFLG
jgi:proline iminopeptidase